MGLCDGWLAVLGNNVTALQNANASIQTAISDFQSEVAEITQPMDDALAELNQQTAQAIASLNSMQNEMHQYTGYCLDAAFAATRQIVVTPTAIGNTVITAVSAAVNYNPIMQTINNLNGVYARYGIPNILAKADALLGCLATADCLGLAEIQVYIDTINSILTACFITGEGILDFESLMLATEQYMTGLITGTIIQVSNQIIAMQSALISLQSQAANIVNSFTKTPLPASANVPREYY